MAAAPVPGVLPGARFSVRTNALGVHGGGAHGGHEAADGRWPARGDQGGARHCHARTTRRWRASRRGDVSRRGGRTRRRAEGCCRLIAASHPRTRSAPAFRAGVSGPSSVPPVPPGPHIRTTHDRAHRRLPPLRSSLRSSLRCGTRCDAHSGGGLMTAPPAATLQRAAADETPAVLAVGIDESGPLLDGISTRVLPLAVRETLESFVRESEPSAKPGEVRELPLPGQMPARVIVAGVGKASVADLRLAGAALGRAALTESLTVALPGVEGAELSGLVEGTVLGGYRYEVKSERRVPGTVFLAGV